MSLKPGDYYVRAIDFLGALVPGAILTYCVTRFVEYDLLDVAISKIAGGTEGWVVFVVASMIVGFFIQVPASLLDPLYDRTYRRWKAQSVTPLLSGVAKLIPGDERQGSAYEWAEARIAARAPEQAQALERLQAVSKLLRAISFISLVACIIAWCYGHILAGGVLLLVALMAFLVFSQRRLAATKTTYRFVLDQCESAHGKAGRSAPLLGTWNCTWDVLQPSGFEPRPILDRLHISSGSGGALIGKGENPIFGEFVLTAEESRFAVAVIYHGPESKPNEPLLGVVLLRWRGELDELEGEWIQYSTEHDFFKGTVLWSRSE